MCKNLQAVSGIAIKFLWNRLLTNIKHPFPLRTEEITKKVSKCINTITWVIRKKNKKHPNSFLEIWYEKPPANTTVQKPLRITSRSCISFCSLGITATSRMKTFYTMCRSPGRKKWFQRRNSVKHTTCKKKFNLKKHKLLYLRIIIHNTEKESQEEVIPKVI